MSPRTCYLRLTACAAAMVGVVVVVTEVVRIDMERGASARLFLPDDAPAREVAIVLGAPPGQLLAYRMDAACALMTRGAAQRLLLTGTTEEMPYMRARAEACVAAERMLVDDQAERTWNNLENARLRFGVTSALVVSQRYHLPRALALADALGLDALGVVAVGEPRLYGRLRERFARLRALVDGASR